MPAAPWYWARTSAGARPRFLTCRPCALAQVRMSVLVAPSAGVLRPLWVVRVVPATLRPASIYRARADHSAAVPGRTAPCRRAGGAVRTRCRRRRHSPRVAALAPASARGAHSSFVAGEWQVRARIYLGCTLIDLQMASTAIAVSGQGMMSRTCLYRQDASGEMADNGCAD